MTDPAEHIVRLREALRRRIGLPLGGEIEDAIAQVTDVLEAAQKEIDLLRKPNSATIVLDSYAAENQRLFDRAEKAESALADEREACARIADQEALQQAAYTGSFRCRSIAAAIRARSKGEG